MFQNNKYFVTSLKQHLKLLQKIKLNINLNPQFEVYFLHFKQSIKMKAMFCKNKPEHLFEAAIKFNCTLHTFYPKA